jgi:TrmH family RNA methyltransferase
MAIRTAEVSGADGIIVDAQLDHAARRSALRFAMRADWYMPVLWERAGIVLAGAAEAGRRIIGVEDVGTQAPWEVDLTGRVLLVVGGETHGIPAAVLERCDCVVRIPTAGFIPSYNLQAAVAAIATERLRQAAKLS